MACRNPLILRTDDGAEYEIMLVRVRTRVGVRWTWVNVGGFRSPVAQHGYIEECVNDILRNPDWGFASRQEAWQNAREYQGVADPLAAI